MTDEASIDLYRWTDGRARAVKVDRPPSPSMSNPPLYLFHWTRWGWKFLEGRKAEEAPLTYPEVSRLLELSRSISEWKNKQELFNSRGDHWLIVREYVGYAHGDHWLVVTMPTEAFCERVGLNWANLTPEEVTGAGDQLGNWARGDCWRLHHETMERFVHETDPNRSVSLWHTQDSVGTFYTDDQDELAQEARDFFDIPKEAERVR